MYVRKMAIKNSRIVIIIRYSVGISRIGKNLPVGTARNVYEPAKTHINSTQLA